MSAEGVIDPGKLVLEVGAGSGVATRDVVRAGSEVAAIEPARELARLLTTELEDVTVLVTTLEDAALPDQPFDSVLAETSMHWVDLSTG